jgi:hypothetical protein
VTRSVIKAFWFVVRAAVFLAAGILLYVLARIVDVGH